MAAPITKLRIGLQPDTPEEHTRLLINVNTEEAQTSLQITTDLRVRANPATAKIHYYNFDGSELLYTETIDPGSNGSWDGEPGRASTAQYEFIFNGWATEPDQVDPTADATAGVYSARRVYAAYKRRDISGFVVFESPGAFFLRTNNNAKNWDGTLLYSTNATDWIEWDGTTISSAASGGSNRLLLRGIGNSVITRTANKQFVIDAALGVSCYGNIECLLDFETVLAGQHPALGTGAFIRLFSGCAQLTTAPELPATTLAQICYKGMFYSCPALESAPELPATTLAIECYSEMFSGCVNLTTAPDVLPATVLASECYKEMFSGCRLLKKAPKILATTLANNCCAKMFNNCPALESAPELPATILAAGCYSEMFLGCASLTTAPDILPATTLAPSCYYRMFANCSILKVAPALPAMTAAWSCYNSMFDACKQLRNLPDLPATTLAYQAYYRMFRGCEEIKASETQTSEYATPFRIPSSGTATADATALNEMFANTGGTFTGTPTINTTYYLAPPAAA